MAMIYSLALNEFERFYNENSKTSEMVSNQIARARRIPWWGRLATSRRSCARASRTTTRAMSGASDASSTKCAHSKELSR